MIMFLKATVSLHGKILDSLFYAYSASLAKKIDSSALIA